MRTFKTSTTRSQAEPNDVKPSDVEDNFTDLHLPLNSVQAGVEASRCLYCFDAPCMTACPTKIDIPKFIRQISVNKADDAAMTILSQNILGGTCARACPTEILCEEVCVVNHSEGSPVKIGDLQRHAVDGLLQKNDAHPFTRKPLSGFRFAVIGAGPAGLAFSHRLAMLGHDVVIFDKNPKAGGLNEYGLAAYKMVDDFAQREISFLLDIGGIEIKNGQIFGVNLTLKELLSNFDGVFIGVGLPVPRDVQMRGNDLAGVSNALDFIAHLRQAPDVTKVPIGNDIVVIGGGNTAIDAAVQARCLGARNVTLAYRRGPDDMGATLWERELALVNGVTIKYWLSPKEFSGTNNIVEQVVFETMQMREGKLIPTGEVMNIPADMVLKAIGQEMNGAWVNDFETRHGKIVVNEHYQTSIDRVYAGGDCIASGEDLTVQAVEDGKQAAHRADVMLRERNNI